MRKRSDEKKECADGGKRRPALGVHLEERMENGNVIIVSIQGQ